MPGVPLSSGTQTIIWMQILGDINSLKNNYEQIYLFVDMSGWNSYRLAEMSANLRNGRFYEISVPGVECIIWMPIPEDIDSLKNDYEHNYLFVDMSSWNSYQLAEMSANLRNGRFDEMSDPGAEFESEALKVRFWNSRVECFAPSCVYIYNQF